MAGPALYDWPAFKAYGLIFMNHGSHALGIARAAVESAIEIASTKVGWGGVPLRMVPTLQTIAEATAEVEAASAYHYGVAEALLQAGPRGSR